MIVKWITCSVEPDMRPAFSQAQEGWRNLRGVDGFCGQVGGWKKEQQGWQAHLAGLWRDQESYRAFMERTHDAIIAVNRQAGTYAKISVTLEEVPDQQVAARLLHWCSELSYEPRWTVQSGVARWDSLIELGSH